MYSYQSSILFNAISIQIFKTSAQISATSANAISMLFFPSIAEKSENAFVKKNIFNHRLFKFHIK